MSRRRFPGLPTVQADRRDGMIATLTDGHVMHALGSRRAALLAVVAECDRRGVRVQSLSTPQTIFRDLQGSRDDHHGHLAEGPAFVSLPERSLLGYVGRLDLAPSVAAGVIS